MPRYKAVKINGKKVDLHVAIWEKANGPRPKGHVIHHIDGDHNNNDLSNLQLMTYTEHNRHHFKGTGHMAHRRLDRILHGTDSGYSDRKCRCDECRAYNRNKRRRYMGRPLEPGWAEKLKDSKKNHRRAMDEIQGNNDAGWPSGKASGS